MSGAVGRLIRAELRLEAFLPALVHARQADGTNLRFRRQLAACKTVDPHDGSRRRHRLQRGFHLVRVVG